MNWKYIVVGAGFSGAVLAEKIANELNEEVLIIESRNHIGGNAYDCYDENGIMVHKYGPHIFHTAHKDVWNYLSQFTKWIPYQHKVLGLIDGKKVPIPFNLNTLHSLYPKSLAEKIEGILLEKYGLGSKVSIIDLRESGDKDLKELAEFVYQKVFLNYTIKQWDYKPEELAENVTGRVPVVVGRDDRYFQDKYQGIPKLGYTQIFEKMLSNPKIHIMLQTDFFKIKDQLKYEKLVYTGMLDQFFEYSEGRLPYRTLDFEWENLQKEWFQDAGTENYPNNYDFTRITEYKHYTSQKTDTTTIMKEYSRLYDETKGDVPYYPIPKDEFLEQKSRYEKLIKKEKDVLFLGRLATYNYFNMDQVILAALNSFGELKKSI
jgi:UDP-galactopyranose mutase